MGEADALSFSCCTTRYQAHVMISRFFILSMTDVITYPTSQAPEPLILKVLKRFLSQRDVRSLQNLIGGLKPSAGPAVSTDML